MSNVEFLAAFENAGFIRDGAVVQARVRSTSAADIFDFAQQLAIVTAIDALPPAQTLFTFAATTTLGGGTTPCSATECRLRHVAGLREFATLYSDRVFIHNFFAERYSHRERLQSIDDDAIQHRFLADLEVLVEVLAPAEN